MSTSPELVVDTLNRYLLLDSPNVNFLDSIDLRYAADGNKQQPAAFVLTFTFQHATHSISLHLEHSTEESGTVYWHISDVDASHPLLVSGTVDSTPIVCAALDFCCSFSGCPLCCVATRRLHSR